MQVAEKNETNPQGAVEAFSAEACRALFKAYGVELVEIDPNTASPDTFLLSAVIGFTGPGLRGTLILASTEMALRDSNPTDGSLRDWIAELANQLVGRVKNSLLRSGAEVYVTTPVVMRGEHLAPLPRFVLMPQAFAAKDRGKVFLWVEVEAAPGFRLSPTLGEVPVDEGSTLLF
jgi:CheY-specific phosphatase CheX